MLNPIWSITATATLKIQSWGRRWGTQISSFYFCFPGLSVAQQITQSDLVKCLSGPMNLGFLAVAQNRFQHLPPFFPMCIWSHACTKCGAQPAVQSTEKWEMRIQALSIWRKNWTPVMLFLSRPGCCNNELFSKFSKWVRCSHFCLPYQDVRNRWICIWRKI